MRISLFIFLILLLSMSIDASANLNKGQEYSWKRQERSGNSIWFSTISVEIINQSDIGTFGIWNEIFTFNNTEAESYLQNLTIIAPLTAMFPIRIINPTTSAFEDDVKGQFSDNVYSDVENQTTLENFSEDLNTYSVSLISTLSYYTVGDGSFRMDTISYNCIVHRSTGLLIKSEYSLQSYTEDGLITIDRYQNFTIVDYTLTTVTSASTFQSSSNFYFGINLIISFSILLLGKRKKH